ncbi:MAG: hypothetical protein PHH26_01395 [Candidatus Thermoplasmatota archaeon]|nr:hypothetical protein [Candidatus Thermoplasmatota archaeon]
MEKNELLEKIKSAEADAGARKEKAKNSGKIEEAKAFAAKLEQDADAEIRKNSALALSDAKKKACKEASKITENAREKAEIFKRNADLGAAKQIFRKKLEAYLNV